MTGNASKLPGVVGLGDLTRFEKLKATGDLPSPKGSALAIIRLTQKDSTSIDDLAHAVKTDPAFVGRLIKAANAVQAVGRRPVASIRDALMVLGIPAVRSLALGFSLLSGYRSGNCKNFDYKRYWSRSLVCAIALQALAMRTRAIAPEEAFSVGLLAYIGELALATMYPDDYSRLLDRSAADRSLRLTDMEHEAFVMTHGELTAAMTADWGLPRVFHEPLLYVENVEQAPFAEGSRQYQMLHNLLLARFIAEVCMAGEADRRAMMAQLFLLGGRVSIEAESLVTICDKVVHDWSEWGAMLAIDFSPVPSFEQANEDPPGPIPGVDRLPAADEGGRLRILVVDDDGAIRALLRGLLMQSGHEVFEATNGRQAFEMALDLRPHLMVLDWLMPEMDGIELTRALRQTRIGRGIYILLLTGQEGDEKLVEAFEAGIDDFMTKPLKSRVFGARLRAGQRLIGLQQEIERDREEIRKFAAELAVTNRRLQEVALTDSLTGFPNRRFAMERIQQEWLATNRSKRPLSCMVIDIDEFKRINDTYGHDVGDEVLKQTAQALKGALRGPDVVCRIGGDEFLVICPDTAVEAALACGERVRLAVEQLAVQTGVLQLKCSLSIGVATRVASMDGIDALIKEADRGTYIAKQRGRNRVASVQQER